MGQQVNRAAEKNLSEAGSICTSSTAVPESIDPTQNMSVPESSQMKQNTLPVPEPVEPTQNMSIPAAAAKSTIAFDELGGVFAIVHFSLYQTVPTQLSVLLSKWVSK